MKRLLLRLSSSLFTLLAAACASSETDATFGSHFEETARVELEERSASPIVGIASVQQRPGGGFAISDAASHVVRMFGASGDLERVLGGAGDGPGELDSPTAAIELPDGRVFVTQRANPRLTEFRPDAEPTMLSVPGQYGFWAARIAEGLAVGVGSREFRFAVLDYAGTVRSRFGALDPAVNETPFWIFFARDHATVVGETVVTNTSFSSRLRLFDANGDSLGTIGVPPPSWVPPTAPPVDRMSGPEDRARIERWSQSFTVVRAITTVAERYVVVQYGRHSPATNDPYHVNPTTIDVYELDGAKLLEDAPLAFPVVGGGEELLVLTAEPPEPWTLSVYEWTDGGR